MSGKQLLVLRELLYLTTKCRISWFISKKSWLQPENDRFARKQDGLTSNSYSWLQFKSILSMFLMIHFLNISQRHMKNFLVPPVLSSSFPKWFLNISTISILPNFSSIFPTYNPIFPVGYRCFQYSPQVPLISTGFSTGFSQLDHRDPERWVPHSTSALCTRRDPRTFRDSCNLVADPPRKIRVNGKDMGTHIWWKIKRKCLKPPSIFRFNSP